MKEIKQAISGNSNIQIAGDVVLRPTIKKVSQVSPDSDIHISDAQAKHIRDLVLKIAESLPQKYAYSNAYKGLYDKFNITSYKLLPKELYEDAVVWLGKQIAINRVGLKKNNLEQYRKDLYKSIHARANQLHIDIHELATRYLGTNKPVASLTELSDRRLAKLYQHLYSLHVE